MSGLEKATLTKLGNDPSDTEGTPIPVQFNPASLRLTLSNNTEGGRTPGRPARQFTGNASTDLSFELVFDTADEDDGRGGPRSVREKTALIEQFVLSEGEGAKRKSPPRVKFHWDRLILKGVITSVTVDFDLFAANGTPLRAKVGVSIKEQDAKYEIGTSTEKNAPAPGGLGAGPGTVGLGISASARLGIALEGESLADFSVRMGVEAGAWRGLAAGLEGTLSLSAGTEIDFDSSVSLSPGVGVSVGFEADVGISLEASLGLEASASLSAGASAGAGASASPGFALSAAGGVGAAVETVKIAKAQAAASDTIRAFGAAAATPSASVATGGTSVAVSGAAVPYAAAAVRPAAALPSATPSPAAYAPPRADPRATAFGLGVPLRPSVTGAAATTQGVVALRPYTRAADVPTTRDPTVPAWTQLPATGANRAQGRPAAPGAHRTGCGCGCGPRGGAR